MSVKVFIKYELILFGQELRRKVYKTQVPDKYNLGWEIYNWQVLQSTLTFNEMLSTNWGRLENLIGMLAVPKIYSFISK